MSKLMTLYVAFEAIRDGRGVDYEGASATSLEFDSNGDPRNCSFTFWTVKDSRVVFTNHEGDAQSVTISL